MGILTIERCQAKHAFSFFAARENWAHATIVRIQTIDCYRTKESLERIQ